MFPADNGSQIQAYPTAMLWVGGKLGIRQVFERATAGLALVSVAVILPFNSPTITEGDGAAGLSLVSVVQTGAQQRNLSDSGAAGLSLVSVASILPEQRNISESDGAAGLSLVSVASILPEQRNISEADGAAGLSLVSINSV